MFNKPTSPAQLLDMLRAAIHGFEMAHRRTPDFVLLSSDLGMMLRAAYNQQRGGDEIMIVHDKDGSTIKYRGIEVGQVTGEARIELVNFPTAF